MCSSVSLTTEDQARDDHIPKLPDIPDGDDGDIVNLSEASFNEALRQHEYVLALLYNSSCPRCKNYMVQLREAAAALKEAGGGVLVGKVDAVQHAGVLEKAVAEGAGDDGEPPLFVWAEKGRLQPCDEFHSEDVVAWVQRKSGRSVGVLDPPSPSDMPSLVSLLADSVTALALALVHDTQSAAAAEFRGASKDVEGVRFALTTHAAVAAALGWQGDAAAALARAGAEGGVVAVLKSRNDTFLLFEGPLTRKAIAEFVHGNRLPLFVHMGDAAAEQFGKNTKWHIVIFCPRTDFSHFEESLTPLARQHVGKVFFMMVDSSDEEMSGQPMDYFGIHEGEMAVLAVLSYTENGEHHESKHRLAGEPTLSNVREFITAFLAGELPPYYKSDPVPDQTTFSVGALLSEYIWSGHVSWSGHDAWQVIMVMHLCSPIHPLPLLPSLYTCAPALPPSSPHPLPRHLALAGQNDGVVRTVVGSTFKEIVMDDSKDVMLMVGQCPSSPASCIYRRHIKVSVRPALLFAAMDYASNEVPGLEVSACAPDSSVHQRSVRVPLIAPCIRAAISRSVRPSLLFAAVDYASNEVPGLEVSCPRAWPGVCLCFPPPCIAITHIKVGAPLHPSDRPSLLVATMDLDSNEVPGVEGSAYALRLMTLGRDQL
ncbi:unnamed protein product [Closterium sp. Yama58-4]|nr:unnamed protein product [Closterium sp. Yama58-4]